MFTLHQAGLGVEFKVIIFVGKHFSLQKAERE
jgi:hypothetical protein